MRLGVGGPWGSTETSSTALDFLTLSCMLTPPHTPTPNPCTLYRGGQESGNPATQLPHRGTWVPIALETNLPIYRRIQWDGCV